MIDRAGQSLDRDQLTAVRFNGLPVNNFHYDPGMREIVRNFGNGLVRMNDYSRGDNLVTDMVVAGKPGLSFGYDYDANKNPVQEITGG